MALASQSSLALVLFLVLVGASTFSAYRPYPDHVYPIGLFAYADVENVGKFAVDEYNKKGTEPHLYFIAVVNGTVVDETYHDHEWYLELKAANCSSLSDTRAALYLAQIYQITFANATNSYNTEFTLRTFYRK